MRWLRPRGSAPPQGWLEANTFLFGTRRVPLRLAEYDTLLSGGKGTGKTTGMVALMCSQIIAYILSGRPFNVLAYTPKPDDFYPVLRALFEPMGVSVRPTNPFMEEAWAWDGALHDLITPPAIDELAVAQIRENGHEQNPFFKKAAQLILRGVILSLATTHPGVWTMRQVYSVIKDLRLARRVLSRCQVTEHLASLLSDEQGLTGHNLHATLLAELKGLELVAALIDETPDHRRFSIRDAANTPGVIYVFGSDPRYNATVEPWNGVQFELLGHELLIRGDIGVDTLLYIDEFPQLNGGAKSTIIRKLLEFGRSSRVRSTLAVQTPAQVIAIYGEHEGQTLLGQMHLAMVFGHKDAYGKAYWSNRFGSDRGFEAKWNESRQWGESWNYGLSPGSSRSATVTQGVAVERFDLSRITPTQIGDLPVGSWELGMFGYAELPISLRPDPQTGFPAPVRWRFHMTPEWIARHVPKVEGFTPYDQSLKANSSYSLRPLEPWEYGFLGLEPPGEASPAPGPTARRRKRRPPPKPRPRHIPLNPRRPER